MRHVRVFGSCFIMALFASACSQSSVFDTSGDDSNAKDVEASLDGTETPAPDINQRASHTDDHSPDVKLDAEVVLAGALAHAKSDDKNVFVHLGAPW